MKVKIKTRKAMKKKFGLNQMGDIKCQYSFTKEMEKALPKDRIIDIDADEYWNGYYFRKDMIEKVITEDKPETDTEFLVRMKLLEEDHTPDGWPPVQMWEVKRLIEMAEKK